MTIPRVLRSIAVGVAALLLLAAPALAQKGKKPPGKEKDPPDTPKNVPGVQLFKEEGKVKKEKQKGPNFSFDKMQTPRQKLALAKLEEQISTAMETLEIDDPKDPVYPLTIVKLADLYWQKSDIFFDKSQSIEVLEGIAKAKDDKNEAELGKWKAMQRSFLDQQTDWRKSAIEQYRRIEKDFPRYKDVDQVLYALGYHLTVMGDKDGGYSYYVKLVREKPQSSLIPDTLLNIGDYFFSKNEFEQAQAFYDKVGQYGPSRVLGYAIFKTGWCYFNLGDKAQALNKFLETIRWTDTEKAKENSARLDLKVEAQNDMVRAYSFIGSPDKAVTFFKNIAPDIYIKLCENLGAIYAEDSNYLQSIKLFRALITEVGRDYRSLRYQREIVYAAFKLGDRERTQKEIAGLSDLLTEWVNKMPAEFKSEEMKELEQLLRVIGTDYHREAEKTLNKPTQLLALFVYEQYLKWFPDAEDYYTMAYNVAILGYQMQQWERAAALFEKVIELKPDGPFTAPAAHSSILCYFKLAQQQAPEEKDENSEKGTYKPRAIEGMDAKFLNACERYLKIAGKDAEDKAEATYAAGVIYYANNVFDKAAPRFIEMYQEHREDPKTQDAAKLLLIIYNVTRDIDNLNKWADEFSRDAAIMGGDLGVKIKEIQAARDFNKCRKMEFDKRFGEAGDCFMAYFNNFPQSKLGDTALSNAAIMYRDAKLIEKALLASERLYNERTSSPIAPRALFNIATIYKTIAVYSEAARYYELYAQNHPKHDPKLLERALARSATYRRALGDYDLAIADYLAYYKYFSGNKRAPLVFFEIGVIYESQQKWKAVVDHFKKYLKSYGTQAEKGHILTAHTKMGIAWWKQGKKKEALAEFATTAAGFKELVDAAKKAGKELEVTEDAAEAVATAKFYEGEVILEDMKAIKLVLPQKVFTERLKAKVELIGQATSKMQEVADFKRPHWEIAAFNRIGQATQDLSAAIENAPIPANLPEDVKIGLQEDFLKKATEVREQAIKAYRHCLEQAKKKQWFNEFSDNAEKNLAALDLDYKFTREVRPQPNYYRANASVPAAIQGKEPKAPEGDAPPKAGGEVPASPSVAAYNEGLAHERKHEWDAALKSYQDAAQKDAQFAEAHARAGAMLQKLGRSGAQDYFDAALKIDKYNATANNVLSEQAQTVRDWDKATLHARYALIGDAESMNAYQNFAHIYFEKGQHSMARLVCGQALEIDKQNAALKNLRGLVWLKLNDVRKAIREFTASVAADPTLAEAHLNLASTVLNYSDFDSSFKHFDAVLKLEPKNLDALLGRSVAERGIGKFDDAQKGYETILAERQGDVDVRYNLCLLLGDYQDKYEKALGYCEDFVRLAPPKHPKLKEVTGRVKAIKSTIEVLKQGGPPPAPPTEAPKAEPPPAGEAPKTDAPPPAEEKTPEAPPADAPKNEGEEAPIRMGEEPATAAPRAALEM